MSVEAYRDLSTGELADMVEIQDLFASYTHLLDIGDVAGYLSLFSADCKFIVHGRTYQGIGGVQEMVSLAEPNGVHLAASPVIRVNGDKATSCQSFLAVRADKKTIRMGWYEDDLTREQGRWRLAIRRVTFIRSDGSLRPPL